jgi:hypothetical protein
LFPTFWILLDKTTHCSNERNYLEACSKLAMYSNHHHLLTQLTKAKHKASVAHTKPHNAFFNTHLQSDHTSRVKPKATLVEVVIRLQVKAEGNSNIKLIQKTTR